MILNRSLTFKFRFSRSLQNLFANVWLLHLWRGQQATAMDLKQISAPKINLINWNSPLSGVLPVILLWEIGEWNHYPWIYCNLEIEIKRIRIWKLYTRWFIKKIDVNFILVSLMSFSSFNTVNPFDISCPTDKCT